MSLQRAGCRIQPGRLLRDAWVLEGGNPAASEAVRHGWVAIQDEASQAVAGLVAADPGNTVLDLCAAPGGKTLLLARAAGAQGHVIAADLHENRVRAMRERFELAGVRNVETVVLDGAQPLPFERPFDRILVDVPCSGTGTLARHPEIRWKLRAEDLARSARAPGALAAKCSPASGAGRTAGVFHVLARAGGERIRRPRSAGRVGRRLPSRRSAERHREPSCGNPCARRALFARTAFSGLFLLSMERMDFLPR